MKVFQNITEGGQLATHSIRMFKQITKISIFFTLIFWMFIFCYQMRDLNKFHVQSVWYYEKARLYQALDIHFMDMNQPFWLSEAGRQHIESLPVRKVLQMTQPYAENLYHVAKLRLKRSGLISLIPFSILIIFFFVRGRQSEKKHHIKGNKLSSAWLTAWRLRLKGVASKISIGPLPLVKGTETQHILVTGGTGSGKTNCLHHLLTAIRRENQRVIIVDTSGTLTDCYYREGKDVLLNPLDLRGSPWHPWIECQDKTSYAAMAESFIPQSLSESDNYWRTSARIVFSSLLELLEETRMNFALAEKILREPLKELCHSVKGTKAASIMDINSEKTAASVRSVLSSFLACFEFLPDTENPFSIRNWVQQEMQSDSWLFISCKTNQRAALNPLLSCWFSVAVRSLLELNPDFERRLWFVIDEFPTLNRLRDLEVLLTESRKYGGCAVLALQSPAQIDAIYGHSSAQTIIGNCATKIVFFEQNPVNAEKIAEVFGDHEVKEYQKGLSYGANDIRDGVNLNQQVRYKPLITKTDIQFLPRNHALVRLPDNYPIVRLSIPIFK